MERVRRIAITHVGSGECRVPASGRVLCKDGEEWTVE
jgi:hypothetical protein